MKISFDGQGNGIVSSINGDYDLPKNAGGIHGPRFELKNGKVVDKAPSKSDEELIAIEQEAARVIVKNAAIAAAAHNKGVK